MLRVTSTGLRIHHQLLAQRCAQRSQWQTRNNSRSSISALQAAFRDPSSPFYISPGTQGPSSPDDPPSFHSSGPAPSTEVSPAEEARAKLLALGYDPTSFWEQPVVWGDHDSFQHVNNVHYVRFFESSRIKWMVALGNEIGGPAKADAMLKAKGVSLILKSITVNYKRPVTYPDTLLIAHKPHDKGFSPTHVGVAAIAYSYAQRAIIADSDSVIVWYDYDNSRKCSPGEKALEILRGKMKPGLEGHK